MCLNVGGGKENCLFFSTREIRNRKHVHSLLSELKRWNLQSLKNGDIVSKSDFGGFQIETVCCMSRKSNKNLKVVLIFKIFKFWVADYLPIFPFLLSNIASNISVPSDNINSARKGLIFNIVFLIRKYSIWLQKQTFERKNLKTPKNVVSFQTQIGSSGHFFLN